MKSSPPRSRGNNSDSAVKRVVTGTGCSRRTTQIMNLNPLSVWCSRGT